MPRRRRRSGHGPVWEPVYPTLDLHGETAESARRRAGSWLEERRGGGERVVRLVTGRGRHSIGPPVLPAEIEDLLRSLRGSVVESFEVERGGGAFRVELRRPDPRRAPRAPRPAAASPGGEELRRAAEERLAELGIAPHPSLVEAEMRRVRGEER
jgi:hypothetical protein